jgi:hypothetical protein
MLTNSVTDIVSLIQKKIGNIYIYILAVNYTIQLVWGILSIRTTAKNHMYYEKSCCEILG